MDGDPAHEQLNDLLALGVRVRSAVQPFTDLRQHILGDGVVGTSSSGSRSASRSSSALSSRSTSADDGVELCVGELAAGVEVDGALAAVLCGVASVEQRGAFSLGDGARARVTALGSARSSSTSSWGWERKREIHPTRRPPPTSRP